MVAQNEVRTTDIQTALLLTSINTTFKIRYKQYRYYDYEQVIHFVFNIQWMISTEQLSIWGHLNFEFARRTYSNSLYRTVQPKDSGNVCMRAASSNF